MQRWSIALIIFHLARHQFSVVIWSHPAWLVCQIKNTNRKHFCATELFNYFIPTWANVR